ncbi:IclR family transcriptional regulator [Baekduia alba]|uniref:IclR family transcriptional regulator n=1 Tax=Baekduia alba TaxID=2997333 RepID=UPI002340CBD0|nr:IclR family transcriptional regulator [Baekduia alba]
MAERPPAAASTSRRSSVQSVGRAFDLLDLLKNAPYPMSALEIARESGLDRTIVHRLLRTLAEHGMVVEERGAYGLGPASVLLANRYLDNLLVRRLALPYLLDLQAGAVGERPWTLTLLIPVGDLATVIERIWTQAAPLGMVLDIGDTFPIDLSAAGRAVLAYRPEEDVRALVGDERYEAVATRLERVREVGGVALSHGEAISGVYAMAATIQSRRGHPVAALSVASLELDDQFSDESALAGQLRRAAQAVGQSLA